MPPKEVAGLDLSFKASADLSAAQYLLVKLHTVQDQIALAAAHDDEVIGILQDAPAAAGRHCLVRVSGVSKCVSGAAVTLHADVISDAAGKGIDSAATSGQNEGVVGKALEATTGADEVFSVLLRPYTRQVE